MLNDNEAKVYVKQTQKGKIFKMPVAIDVYQNGTKNRYKEWLDHKVDTFSFPVTVKPDLINFDGDKILLCEKTDHKTMDNYIFQYTNAGLYVDRREAIDYAAQNQGSDAGAWKILIPALKDKYFGLRLYTLQNLDYRNDSIMHYLKPLILDMASNDPKSLVRAAAIQTLGRTRSRNLSLFILIH